MAGDWIKMRGELWTHPRFLSLANNLVYADDALGLLVYTCGEDALDIGVMPPRNETVTELALRCVTAHALRDVTMCALLRVWCAVNAHCKVDGNDATCCPMRLDDLDDIAGFSGFGNALKAVGWVQEEGDNTLRFPNFRDYNEPACIRAPAKTPAERQRDLRQRRRSERVEAPSPKMPVTARHESNGREEKRREDRSTTSVVDKPQRFDASKIEIHEELNTPRFREAWSAWCKHRSEIRKPLKPTSAAQQLKRLAAMGEARAVEVLTYSIAQGYEGIWEPNQARASPADSRPAHKLDLSFTDEDMQ